MFHLGPDLTLIWKKNNRCSQSIGLSISYKRNLRWKLFTAAAADENENPGNESKEVKSKSTVACDCVKLDTIRQTKAWLNLKNNTPIPF